MLKLYSASWCPYCQKVKSFLVTNKISFEEKDIDTPMWRTELLSLGQRQIPYFIDTDTNTNLFDSGEIIDYVRKKYITKK